MNDLRAEGSPWAKRVVGLPFITVGLLVFYFAVSIFASTSLSSALFSAWVASALICAGSFLIIYVDMRSYLRSVLLAFVVLLGWSMILLIQLPDDLQILLASIVGLVSVMIYRQWSKKKVFGSPSLLSKSRRLSKFVGIFLLVIAVLLFFWIEDVVVVLGPFRIWLVSLPLCLDIFVGLQLVRRKRLKEAIVGWFAYVILTLIPFIPFMPLGFQIPTIALVLTAILLGLLTYRKADWVQ